MLNSSSSPGSSTAAVLVVGLGEIGRPLLEILRGAHQAEGRDLEDRPFDGVQVLHLCFPFSSDFVSSAARYVSLYEPEVVVVNSTVVPGTTAEIQEKTGVPAVYSPVRGKHARMKDELLHYRKFVAGSSAAGRRPAGGSLRRRGHHHAAHVVPGGARTRKAPGDHLLRRAGRLGAGDGPLHRRRRRGLLGNDRFPRRDRLFPAGRLPARLTLAATASCPTSSYSSRSDLPRSSTSCGNPTVSACASCRSAGCPPPTGFRLGRHATGGRTVTDADVATCPAGRCTGRGQLRRMGIGAQDPAAQN